MSDKANNSEPARGTRRLNIEEASALPPEDLDQDTDYPAPWVVELRILGTPSVIQMQVNDELLIGRADTHGESIPDVNLNEFDGYHMGVSRNHAKLFTRNNRLMISDLGSSNGTYINGMMIAKNQSRRVRHGDTLTFGKLELQLFYAVMPSRKNLEKTQPIKYEIPVMGKGQHLLIVDNDEDVANVLRSVLEQAGFQVSIVKSYSEAVGVIEKEMPAGILMELMLPDVSGLDLVRYLRDHKDGESVPLVVVTSATAGYQMGQAIDAGADMFMCKPVGVDEILRGVSKVIE